MINFRDWLNAQESSPFTRTRLAAALGLGPDIPDASINSRSTATPWMIEKLVTKNRKKKIEEAKKVAKTPSYKLDDLYQQALKDKDDFSKFIKKKSEEEKEKAEEDKSEEEKKDKESEDKEKEKDEEADKEKDKKDFKWKPKDSGLNGSSSDGSQPSTFSSQSNTQQTSKKPKSTRSDNG